MVDTARCHCSPIHGKYRDTPRYYDVDYPLLRMLPLPAALNNHSITTCKQLVTAFHQWHNNDVFTFPKRIMTECQPSGCINKSGEGVSKGKKIFKITNATKFPTKRELAIIWLHYIGTGHSVDLLNLRAKLRINVQKKLAQKRVILSLTIILHR